MFVSVIPLKRLPRHISTLDYAVPEEYKKKIQLGQLVTIPFRNTIIFGIVFLIKKELSDELKQKNIKSFEKIIHPEPLLTAQQLSLIQTLAEWYGVSPSVIATMMAPPLQKRKLTHIDIIKASQTKNIPTEQTQSFFYYQNNAERKTFFQKIISGITLILLPTVHDIPEAYELLAKEQQEQCLIWHSNLSQKEQFEAWFSIKNGEKNIILGTRGSVFLPFVNLHTIIIDMEHHEQHKHWDQAPRFHAKDVAKELARCFNANIFYASFSPSAEQYYTCHKKLAWHTIPDTLPALTPGPTIIDMNKEQYGKNFSPLSFPVSEALKDEQGDMFLYLNRRGYAGSISCSSCTKMLTCPTCTLPMTYYLQKHSVTCHPCNINKKVPSRCLSCNGTLTQLKGVGVEQLETFIPHAEHITRKIIRIDSNTEAPTFDKDKTYIIVGTDAAIPFLRWDKLMNIVLVHIDQQLNIPEYTASEHVWHLIETIQYYRKPESTFFIQTNTPHHIVFKGLTEPDRFYRLDLNLRRALLYPPYSYLMRFFYGHENAEYSKKIAEQTYKRISLALTKTPQKLKLLPPIEMQPRYFRKKYWYAIMVKSDPTLWQKNLIWLNQCIPGDWKIDPNPISLLQP